MFRWFSHDFPMQIYCLVVFWGVMLFWGGVGGSRNHKPGLRMSSQTMEGCVGADRPAVGIKQNAIGTSTRYSQAERSRIPPQKISENVGKMWLAGLGVLGGIFIASIIRRITVKLHRIILFHFGFVTVRCHYGTNWNLSFLWFRDFWTCPWFPKPILFIFGDTRIFQRNQETSRLVLGNMVFINLRIWEIEKLKDLENKGPEIQRPVE